MCACCTGQKSVQGLHFLSREICWRVPHLLLEGGSCKQGLWVNRSHTFGPWFSQYVETSIFIAHLSAEVVLFCTAIAETRLGSPSLSTRVAANWNSYGAFNCIFVVCLQFRCVRLFLRFLTAGICKNATQNSQSRNLCFFLGGVPECSLSIVYKKLKADNTDTKQCNLIV